MSGKKFGMAWDYAKQGQLSGSKTCMSLWVLLASGLSNPCPSKLESSRSAVGRRRLALLCWASNSCMGWWK
eukprot:1152654-Pelagomonas_calceolata.AAC.2